MKTKFILGFLVTIFLLISCSNQNDELLNTENDIELIVDSKSTITDSFETYYFGYGMEKVGNEWTDNTFLKLQFEDLSTSLDTLKINGLVIPNIHSNLIDIQVKLSDTTSYKHTFKEILLVSDISLLTNNQIDLIQYQNKIKVVDGKSGWILWNHKGHELITLNTEKSLKVGWKITESVVKVNISGTDYVSINFPLTYNEKTLGVNEEFVIKENGIFK